MISRREEEIAAIAAFPTNNAEIYQNQNSRRVRKFSEIPSLLLLNVVITTVSSKRLGISIKFLLSISENICAEPTIGGPEY